jgi:hypothetical protein
MQPLLAPLRVGPDLLPSKPRSPGGRDRTDCRAALAQAISGPASGTDTGAAIRAASKQSASREMSLMLCSVIHRTDAGS